MHTIKKHILLAAAILTLIVLHIRVEHCIAGQPISQLSEHYNWIPLNKHTDTIGLIRYQAMPLDTSNMTSFSDEIRLGVFDLYEIENASFLSLALLARSYYVLGLSRYEIFLSSGNNRQSSYYWENVRCSWAPSKVGRKSKVRLAFTRSWTSLYDAANVPDHKGVRVDLPHDNIIWALPSRQDEILNLNRESIRFVLVLKKDQSISAVSTQLGKDMNSVGADVSYQFPIYQKLNLAGYSSLLIPNTSLAESTEATIKHYYHNGSVSSSIHYLNGSRNGRARWYFNNGGLNTEVFYKNDTLDGPSRHYYRRTTNDFKRNLNDSIDNDGIVNIDSTGSLYSLLIFKLGQSIDTEFIFYPDGALYNKSPFLNGKSNGQCFWYYHNGNIERQGGYKDNKPTGERIFYDSTGSPTNGLHDVYLAGVKTRIIVKCKNGRADGQLKILLDGRLQLTADFKNGLPKGIWKYYNKKNELTHEQRFSNGILIDEKVYKAE